MMLLQSFMKISAVVAQPSVLYRVRCQSTQLYQTDVHYLTKDHHGDIERVACQSLIVGHSDRAAHHSES